METYLMKIGLGAVAAGVVAGAVMAAEVKPKRAAMQAFMKNKLVHSQAILEGMALERFDAISKNAIRLRDMTKSNLWYSARQPDYMLQTTNYQRSVDSLYMAAVDKNLDRVTDAYASVARSCVDCHRLVRMAQRRVGGVSE